jgi:hypothetical protein
LKKLSIIKKKGRRGLNFFPFPNGHKMGLKLVKFLCVQRWVKASFFYLGTKYGKSENINKRKKDKKAVLKLF